MKQKLIPSAGKLLVHRETTKEFYAYRSLGGVSQEALPDNVRELPTKDGPRTTRSPWGLVVGVGDPAVTEYGKVKPPCEEGDWIAVAQVGMDLPIESGDGTFTFIYCIEFGGQMARLEVICELCGYTDRKNPRQLTCPKCGSGPAAELVAPSLSDVMAVQKNALGDMLRQKGRAEMAKDASKVRS